MPENEFEQLRLEHEAIMLTYREVQQRCTTQIQSLVQEVQLLSQQLLRARAQVIARDSALAWEQEQRQALAMKLVAEWMTAPEDARKTLMGTGTIHRSQSAEELPTQQQLESSLLAADLVICQTGCLSEGAYWRVKDHCKRTGKSCVLVDEPQSLRVFRVHSCAEDGTVVAAQTSLESAN